MIWLDGPCYLLKQIKLDFTGLFKDRDKAVQVFQSKKYYEGYDADAYCLLRSLTNRFQKAYKVNLRKSDEEPGTMMSPTIHFLRHTRAYSLWIQKHMEPAQVTKLLGWNSTSMLLEYYSYMKAAFGDVQAVNYYERYMERPGWREPLGGTAADLLKEITGPV